MDPENTDNIAQCYRLLALCARAEHHPFMNERLVRQLESFTAWDNLPAQAEIHGMGPLLWYHLKHGNLSLPLETQRIISGLYLRHRKWNEFNTQILLDVTSLFEQAGIRAIVLKGLGLAHEYYPDPALRPVSDIDLLLRKDDILPALNLLKDAGHRVSTPQSWNSDLLPKEVILISPPKHGLRAHIELHHHSPQIRSMVDNSLDDEFSGFHGPSHVVPVGKGLIYVPNPMDTLTYLEMHLTRHMFVATNSSPLPLKWFADIVCLVERHAELIDWRRNAALLNRLEVIYSITPFPEHLSSIIPLKQIQPPAGVNRYPQGWPQEVKPEWKQLGFLGYLKRAATSPDYIIASLSSPSPWWLRLQYGISARVVLWYGQVVYRLQVIKMAVAKLRRDR